MTAERTTAARRGGQKKEHQAIVQSAVAEAQREETAEAPAASPSPVSWEERRQMIATAAYFRAERRGFQGGDPAEDWFAAEVEVDRMLQEGGKESKAQFEQRLEAQLAAWDKVLDELGAAAGKAKASARKELERQIEALAARRGALSEQLQQLRSRTAHAWSDVKEGMEKAWDDMRQAIDNVRARFK